MREIFFKYGSRESGWKYYTCTEKETKWDKERASLWELEGNMHHWTYPEESINIGRKNPIKIKDIPMGMDYAKCNFRNLYKKLSDIVKNMKEENFEVDPETTYYYWELTIGNKMWRGANYEPQGLQEIKDCFDNYYKGR